MAPDPSNQVLSQLTVADQLPPRTGSGHMGALSRVQVPLVDLREEAVVGLGTAPAASAPARSAAWPTGAIARQVVDVSVIVITHESADDIAMCLDSLRRLPDRVSYETIVIDNASRDGTADLVQAEHEEVRLIRQHRRRGFAANANTSRGVREGTSPVLPQPRHPRLPGSARGARPPPRRPS
jgi:hypothetical protein